MTQVCRSLPARIFAILVIILATLVLRAGSAPRGALADGPIPAAGSTEGLSVNPTSGPPGSRITIVWTDDGDNAPATIDVYVDSTQIGQFVSGPNDETVSGSVTIPADAQPGDHTISINDESDSSSGSVTFTVTGGESCGRTPGQRCDAIWTDRSRYSIGDTIQYCYSVAAPSYIQVVDTDASGNSQIVASGQDDGTGGCGTGTVTPPTGTETLTLEVSGNGPTDIVRASFQVLGSSCAPSCQVMLSTDRQQYDVGDTIRICFNPHTPSHVRIELTVPNGSQSVIYDADDDGTGGCFNGQAGPPAGARHLHMDVTQGSQEIASADTTFQVVAVKPGGVWIGPSDGQTTGDVITFAAHAYPSAAGAPAIDHVNFTIWWPALGPQAGPWKTVCTQSMPSQGDVYSCNADLAQLGAPAGRLLVSFDVYDQDGDNNLSPNGERSIYYQPPAPATPTSTPAPTATPTPLPTSTPTPTATLTQAPPHKVAVLVSGIGTSLDNTTNSGDCVDTGDTWVQIQDALGENGFGCNDFLRYSYAGGSFTSSGSWVPAPYGCGDTGNHVSFSVGRLVSLLQGYKARHPNTTFVLLGHSLGGLIALQAADQLPAGVVSSVVTIDSPLNHVSHHNLAKFIKLLGLVGNLVPECQRVLWDSDAARDIGDITSSASRSQYLDAEQSIVSQGQAKGIRFMTVGNREDCVWSPSACNLRGDWKNEAATMTVQDANDSLLYDLGSGSCDLSKVINKKGNLVKSHVLDLRCIGDSHGFALMDVGRVVPDIVRFVGRGSS